MWIFKRSIVLTLCLLCNFSAVGEVTFVELFNDENDKPRGCGIVEFETPELASRAVEKMHRFDLKGRKLVVKEVIVLETVNTVVCASDER